MFRRNHKIDPSQILIATRSQAGANGRGTEHIPLLCQHLTREKLDRPGARTPREGVLGNTAGPGQQSCPAATEAFQYFNNRMGPRSALEEKPHLPTLAGNEPAALRPSVMS